jgi:hypothetical protein
MPTRTSVCYHTVIFFHMAGSRFMAETFFFIGFQESLFSP